MQIGPMMKLIAVAIAFVTATQTEADHSPRISTGTVKGKVGDTSVWTAAAEAYAETVKQIKAKEGKQ